MATRTTEESAVKSILFIVHEDDGLEARLQAALSLARACSAHLQLLQVIPVEAFTVADSYGSTFVSGEVMEVLQAQSDKLRTRIGGHLKNEDVSWSYEVTTSVIVPEVLKNASFADIVFIGRQPSFHEFTRTGPSILGEIVCATRTPLCIPGDRSGRFDPFGSALIAWNGSIECANAVRSTIGLLKMASKVRVVRYTEGKELSLDDERLMEYLSRHGVHAEFDTHLPRIGVPEDLIEYASKMGAEYVVMGGYSHSRAGEFLFGGVTRQLLHDCSVTLVMGH
jgi:hypothetical protein